MGFKKPYCCFFVRHQRGHAHGRWEFAFSLICHCPECWAKTSMNTALFSYFFVQKKKYRTFLSFVEDFRSVFDYC